MQYYQPYDTELTCIGKVVKIQAYIEMCLYTSVNNQSELS